MAAQQQHTTPPRQIHSRVIPATPEEGNVAMSFTLPCLVMHKHIHRGNAGNTYQGGFDYLHEYIIFYIRVPRSEAIQIRFISPLLIKP